MVAETSVLIHTEQLFEYFFFSTALLVENSQMRMWHCTNTCKIICKYKLLSPYTELSLATNIYQIDKIQFSKILYKSQERKLFLNSRSTLRYSYNSLSCANDLQMQKAIRNCEFRFLIELLLRFDTENKNVYKSACKISNRSSIIPFVQFVSTNVWIHHSHANNL